MLPKYLFYLAFGTLLLSGCGLDTDDDEDETTTVVVEVEQNPYLPLTNATTMTYTLNEVSPGDIVGDITYDVGMSNTKGYPVYKVSLSGTDLNVDLNFRTTSDQIQLLEIDGPVNLGDSDVIDEITFSTPLKLIGNLSATTTAIVSGEVSGRTLEDAALSVTYTLTNTTGKFGEGDAKLPALQAHIEADLTVPLAADPIPLVLDFYFTRGLGMVQHSVNFTEGTTPDYEIEFYGLNDLPNIIWFNQSGNLANASNNIVTLNDNGTPVALSSADYKIANQSELDTYSWLSIDDETDDSFTVSVDSSDDSYPSSLSSVQVLFESLQDGERLSGSIIVLAE